MRGLTCCYSLSGGNSWNVNMNNGNVNNNNQTNNNYVLPVRGACQCWLNNLCSLFLGYEL